MQSYLLGIVNPPGIVRFLVVILCGGFLINDAVRYWLLRKLESRRGLWD